MHEKAKPSIAELAALVEKLSELYRRLMEQPELAAAPPESPLVEGRPLEHWLPGRWGVEALDDAPALSRPALDGLHQRLSTYLEQQKADLARRAAAQERLDAGQEARRIRVDEELAEAKDQYDQAAGALPELEDLTARAVTAAQAARQRAMSLGRWLKEVRPKGVSRFVDAQGRLLTQAALAKAKERSELAWRQTKSLESQAAESAAIRDQALARRNVAAGRLERARAAAEECRTRGAACERAGRELERIRGRLAQREREAAGARSLRVLYGRLLAMAGQLLPSGRLDLVPTTPPEATLALAEEVRALAARRQRLDGLCRRQDAALARREREAAEVSRRVRRLNRAIAEMEKDLPGLLKPFSAEDADPDRRAQAAAGLTTLHCRATGLRAEAATAQERLETLVREQESGLARLRRLQEAYKETSKAQRSGQDQVRAAVEEARLAAQERLRGANDLQEMVRPVMEALGGLSAAELAPTLTRLAGVVAGLEREAADMSGLGDSLADLGGETLPPGPIRTPVKIKPRSANLRRLAARRVELDRLAAVARGARQWQNVATGPLGRVLSRPAQQVALSLGKSLALAVADHQETRKEVAGLAKAVEAAEALAAEQRRRAAERLAVEERRTAQQEQDLYRLRLKGRRQDADMARMAERLEALEGLEREAAELERQLTEAGEDRRLQAQAQAKVQARADAHRAKSLNLFHQLKAVRQERDRALEWREAHDRMGKVAERAKSDLEAARRELSRAKGELGQTREELDAVRADRDQALEWREAYEQSEANGQHSREELAATRHELGRTREEMEALRRERDQALQWREAYQESESEAGRVRDQLAIARHDLDRAREDLARASAERDQALDWRDAHGRLELTTNRTQGALETARADLEQARARLEEMRADRNQARDELAAAREHIAAQELELAQIQRLEAEVASAQAEAGRWAATAADLSAALAASGLAAQEEMQRLNQELASVGAHAHRLEQHLGRLSVMVAMAWQPPQAGRRPVGVRLTPLTPEQVEKALKRLSQAKKRLTDLGGSLGHWALILGVTTGLVFMQPSTPSKATLHESPLALSHLVRPAALTRLVPERPKSAVPHYEIGASGQTLVPPTASASLSLDLVPLTSASQELPAGLRRQVRTLARQAGLSPAALMTSARAVFQGRTAVEPTELVELAESARLISRRHPGIFRDLVHLGLPTSALDLARLEGESEEGRHLFLDRLYREYRALGFEPAESLGAIAANERAVEAMREAWALPKTYAGKVRPIKAVEKLELDEFLDKVSPYIAERCQWYLKATGRSFNGDIDRYAKYLAYDMYCAAKKFDVPVSLMMAIAHQETFYANVLGDQRRSASPFQIFRPTLKLICDSLERNRFVAPPKDVKLQEHLTLATYLAAFHLRELMQDAYRPSVSHRPAYIDMDRVMKRYNGSSLYAGRVAGKRAELVAFLKEQSLTTQ